MKGVLKIIFFHLTIFYSFYEINAEYVEIRRKIICSGSCGTFSLLDKKVLVRPGHKSYYSRSGWDIEEFDLVITDSVVQVHVVVYAIP